MCSYQYVVFDLVSQLFYCWGPTIWGSVCRAVLHSHCKCVMCIFYTMLHATDIWHNYLPIILAGHMGEPVLLHVWIFVSCVFDSHYCVLRGVHSDDIFSAMWRELPLVVEVFSSLRLCQLLCLCLFYHVLLHQGGSSLLRGFLLSCLCTVFTLACSSCTLDVCSCTSHILLQYECTINTLAIFAYTICISLTVL